MDQLKASLLHMALLNLLGLGGTLEPPSHRLASGWDSGANHRLTASGHLQLFCIRLNILAVAPASHRTRRKADIRQDKPEP